MCFPSMVKVQSSYSLKASFSCTLSLGTKPHGSRQMHSLYHHGKKQSQSLWISFYTTVLLVHEVWHTCIWMTLLPLSSCIFPCINFTPLKIPFNSFAPFFLQMLINTEHICTNTFWSHGNFPRLYQSICSFVLALSSVIPEGKQLLHFVGPTNP